MKFIRLLGRTVLDVFTRIGEFSIFAFKGITGCVTLPVYGKSLLQQCLSVGFYALPVVGLTAVFAGFVLALQSYSGFAGLSGENTVSAVVVVAITRELGPVLAGLMVAGRTSAAMAAEIGSMRVSEQIDALETLGVDPFKFLVAPRLIAGVCMMPLLVLVADIIGVFGGFFVGVTRLSFSPGVYIDQFVKHTATFDVVAGLVKAAFFGLSIALCGCYYGFTSVKGARGVGEAATYAVVSASIGILILNYLITTLFFGL
ncbi:MAG: ABC transporter permease [Holosporales bacterium]|jgi:phospholipid/cholesterol/gamma-HCH transport system permease protein|nr:ABC transporter permease [Holosporales bacterium]